MRTNMPDFPRIATPSEVWAYGARELTGLTGIPRSDLLGEDADFETGSGTRKANLANLDTAVSSRSSHAAGEIWAVAARTLTNLDDVRAARVDNLDALLSTRLPTTDFDTRLPDARATKIDNVDASITSRLALTDFDTRLSDARAAKIDNVDVAISTRSSHAADAIWAVATRALTTLAGTPRTDLIGEDVSFEEATGRPAKIPRLDTIPAYETAIESSILMDGSEQILVEKTDDKIGLLDGYIDLTPMVAGNTIVIRQSMKVKAAGDYVVYATETYSGAQSTPLLHIVTKTAKTSIKVTAEQTDAAYVTLDVQFFRRLQA